MQEQKVCRVCNDIACCYLSNVLTCDSCQSFFLRYSHSHAIWHCPTDNNCQINKYTRKSCRECRLAKCLAVGLNPDFVGRRRRRVKRNDEGKVCLVCNDKAHGINYNVLTCISCKIFFLNNKNAEVTTCSAGNNSCEIDKYTRNCCRGCRLAKCRELGMRPKRMRRVRINDEKNTTEKTQVPVHDYPTYDQSCSRNVAPQLMGTISGPNSELSNTLANEPGMQGQKETTGIGKEVCLVCNDTASVSYNYGAISCSPCSVFFRTNIDSKEKLHCRKSGRCRIEKNYRRSCKKCRLDKCLAAGMSIAEKRRRRNGAERPNKGRRSKRDVTAQRETSYTDDCERREDLAHHNVHTSSRVPTLELLPHDFHQVEPVLPTMTLPPPQSYTPVHLPQEPVQGYAMPLHCQHPFQTYPAQATSHIPYEMPYMGLSSSWAELERFKPPATPMPQSMMPMDYRDMTGKSREYHTMMSPPPPSHFSSVHQHQQGFFEAYSIQSVPHCSYEMPQTEIHYSWLTPDRS